MPSTQARLPRKANLTHLSNTTDIMMSMMPRSYHFGWELEDSRESTL